MEYPRTYYVDNETGELSTRKPKTGDDYIITKKERIKDNTRNVYDKYIHYRILNKQLTLW